MKKTLMGVCSLIIGILLGYGIQEKILGTNLFWIAVAFVALGFIIIGMRMKMYFSS